MIDLANHEIDEINEVTRLCSRKEVFSRNVKVDPPDTIENEEIRKIRLETTEYLKELVDIASKL